MYTLRVVVRRGDEEKIVLGDENPSKITEGSQQTRGARRNDVIDYLNFN